MKKIIYILTIITFFTSCNSDDNTETKINYYALTVGNSWVYNNYTFNDDTNTYEDTGVVNTISIVGTEDILGDTYYKFKNTTTGNTNDEYNGDSYYYLRDYNGSLINEENVLYFTYNNFDEIEVRKTGSMIYYFKLQVDQSDVTTDVGTFDCHYGKTYNVPNTDYSNNESLYYSKEIGLIQRINESSYNGNLSKRKRVLVSYNIQ